MFGIIVAQEAHTNDKNLNRVKPGLGSHCRKCLAPAPAPELSSVTSVAPAPAPELNIF